MLLIATSTPDTFCLQSWLETVCKREMSLTVRSAVAYLSVVFISCIFGKKNSYCCLFFKFKLMWFFVLRFLIRQITQIMLLNTDASRIQYQYFYQQYLAPETCIIVLYSYLRCCIWTFSGAMTAFVHYRSTSYLVLLLLLAMSNKRSCYPSFAGLLAKYDHNCVVP